MTPAVYEGCSICSEDLEGSDGLVREVFSGEGMESRLQMPGKHSSTELHPQPDF